MPDASGREYESYELDLLLQRRYFIQIVALKSIDDLDGFIASSAKPPWIWYHRAGQIQPGTLPFVRRSALNFHSRRIIFVPRNERYRMRDTIRRITRKYTLFSSSAISLRVKNGWISPPLTGRFFSGSIPDSESGYLVL